MCCAYKLFLNKNGQGTNSWCPFNLLIRSNKHIATGKATTCHNKLSIRELNKHETATARASNVRPSLHIFLAREFWMVTSSLKCFDDLLHHMIITKRHESSVLLLDSGDEILGIFGPATFAWPLVMRLQWINLGCCFWWSSTLQTTTPGSIPEAVQPCWIKLVATNVRNSNWVDDKTEGKKQQAISDTRYGITQKRQHKGTLSTVVLIFNRILRMRCGLHHIWDTPTQVSFKGLPPWRLSVRASSHVRSCQGSTATIMCIHSVHMEKATHCTPKFAWKLHLPVHPATGVPRLHLSKAPADSNLRAQAVLSKAI